VEYVMPREFSDALLLPPRARLLHIGPMKTGTTSIQAAARKRRKILLDHGVRYPGKSFNHRRQLGALMGWSVDSWKRSGPLIPDLMDIETASAPARKEWDKLAAEMDADPQRRIFISHEYVSQVDDATAQRIVDGIGERTHVCITLRAPGEIVPSLWSQGIRDDAVTESFNDWLARVYGKEPCENPMPERFWRAYDQGRLVDRWARLVGPENVTVIVADKSEPGLLPGAFEGMLGLPAGTLDAKLTHRSLTAVEAELFRAVNADLRDNGADWMAFFNFVRRGAISRGSARRKVPPDVPRVRLPPWAAQIADKDGRSFADSIRRSQVRVVGDLEALAAESRTAHWEDFASVPIDLAADTVAGAVSAGRNLAGKSRKKIQAQADEISAYGKEISELKRNLAAVKSHDLAQHAHLIAANERAPQMASAFTTRELAAAIKHQLLRKLRARLNALSRRNSD
jgi:hypothetical protein